MDKFSTLALLVLVVCSVANHSEATCRRITLNSNGFAYNRLTVSGAAKVTSISVVTRYSNSACARDATFGAYGADIWVNRGCRAKFDVCYIPGTSAEVTCSSNDYRPASCSVSGSIRSVAVKRHRSNSPCVPGFSFRFAGSSLHVSNGCRATFVVGYVH
ncbi:hypothetical protein EGW08_019009 [Elysia chlorotica]|uniref:Uncharacterized protein n=1 Tax=Elysia chlorotica TaxID=188477 RepID=A0A3S0ZQY6_ELYCH|nr:hypothetical protein EGW08_019009 [Elysia chlorotica]